MIGQRGWVAWDQLDDGRRVFTGCRYATLSMGVWESDAVALSAKVDAMQRGFIERTFVGVLPGDFEHRWASVHAHTCDQLPLVGPRPGKVAEVLCLGFGGLDASYALRAGEAVAEGLLTGTAAGVPRFIRPDRLV